MGGNLILNVAELGVEPSLRDYEPHVHRTLPRASIMFNYNLNKEK